MDLGLFIKIKAVNQASEELRKITEDIAVVGRESETLRSSFSKLGVGLSGISAGLIMFGKKSVDAIAQIQQEGAKIPVLLKNQGVAYEQVKKSIDDYTASVQKKTIYEDDYVRGTLSMLLARQLNLQQAMKITTAATQMAMATDADLRSTTLQLTYATQGRASMLVRLGVLTIKQAREIDKLATQEERAQKVTEILNERFGGMSESVSGTHINSIKRFQNAFGDLQENLGRAFLPTLTNVVQSLTTLVTKINELPQPIFTIASVLGALVAALTGLAGVSLLFASRLPAIIVGLSQMRMALIFVTEFIKASVVPIFTKLGAILTGVTAVGFVAIGIAAAGAAAILISLFKAIKAQNEALSLQEANNKKVSNSIAGVGLKMKEYNSITEKSIKSTNKTKSEVMEYMKALSIMRMELVNAGKAHENIDKALEHARKLYKAAKVDVKELTDEEKRAAEERKKAREEYIKKIKEDLADEIKRKEMAIDEEILKMKKAGVDKSLMLEWEKKQRQDLADFIKKKTDEKIKTEQDAINKIEDAERDQFEIQRKRLEQEVIDLSAIVKDKEKIKRFHAIQIAKIDKAEFEYRLDLREKENKKQEEDFQKRYGQAVNYTTNLTGAMMNFYGTRIKGMEEETNATKKFWKDQALSGINSIYGEAQFAINAEMWKAIAALNFPKAAIAAAQLGLLVAGSTGAKALVSSFQEGGYIRGTKEGKIVRVGEEFTNEFILPEEKIVKMLERTREPSKPITINFNGLVTRPRETAWEIKKLLERFRVINSTSELR